MIVQNPARFLHGVRTGADTTVSLSARVGWANDCIKVDRSSIGDMNSSYSGNGGDTDIGTGGLLYFADGGGCCCRANPAGLLVTTTACLSGAYMVGAATALGRGCICDSLDCS